VHPGVGSTGNYSPHPFRPKGLEGETTVMYSPIERKDMERVREGKGKRG
jgi:hypothetical protein